MDDRLYTMEEAMEYLRVSSRNTLYNLMQSGKLVGSQLGATWRFRKSDLDAALVRQDIGRPTREQLATKSIGPYIKRT